MPPPRRVRGFGADVEDAVDVDVQDACEGEVVGLAHRAVSGRARVGDDGVYTVQCVGATRAPRVAARRATSVPVPRTAPVIRMLRPLSVRRFTGLWLRGTDGNPRRDAVTRLSP